MMRREFLSIAGAAPLVAAADSAWIDITRFGAKPGDDASEAGAAKNAAAIQTAIDTCAAAGGGTVRIPPGRFRSAQLRLKTGVALWLDHGADLVASPFPAHYDVRTPVPRTPRHAWGSVFLLGHDVERVAILGTGTIRGAGLARPRVPGASDDKLEPFRPRLVAFESSRDIRVEGVTLVDADRWTLHFHHSDDIRCSGLRIRAAFDIVNTDGIDVDGCRHVVISGCDISCGDDCIVLKTTNYLGDARPMEMVTVSNCTLRTRASALKIGTETHADISMIAFANCVVRGEGAFRPTNAVAIECVDGGRLRGVSVANITATHVQTPVFVRLGDRNRSNPAGECGALEDVIIQNIVAYDATVPSSVTGVPARKAANVMLSDLRITMAGGGAAELATRVVPEKEASYPDGKMFGDLPAHGLYARHVDGLSLRNIDISCDKPDARPVAIADDVQKLSVDSLRQSGMPADVRRVGGDA